MTFKTLPLGEFIKAKKLADKADGLIIALFGDRLPDDAEATLEEAEKVWAEFLTLSAESVSPEEESIGKLSLKQAQGLMADFFVKSAGLVPKPNAGPKSSPASP